MSEQRREGEGEGADLGASSGATVAVLSGAVKRDGDASSAEVRKQVCDVYLRWEGKQNQAVQKFRCSADSKQAQKEKPGRLFSQDLVVIRLALHARPPARYAVACVRPGAFVCTEHTCAHARRASTQ